MSSVLDLGPDPPRTGGAAALAAGLRRFQINTLAYARAAAPSHMAARLHVVVEMKQVGHILPALLNLCDFVVQGCTCKMHQRRVPAEEAKIRPRGILCRQVRRGCLGMVCRSTLPLQRLLQVEAPARPRPPPYIPA